MMYKTQGVCASHISYEVTEDGRVKDVRFVGGCPGGSRAMASLVEGLPVEEAIKRLKGIPCRNGTSCADQLARALAQHAPAK